MKYPLLIESCKRAIESGRCLGCQALEDINFKGNNDCIYNKTPSAEKSIEKIKINLGIQEKMEI